MYQMMNKETVEQFEDFYKTGDHWYPNENIVRLVKGYFEADFDKRLLDYGFGTGENLLYFLRLCYIVSGVEVSYNARNLVEKKLRKKEEIYRMRCDLKVIDEGDTRIPYYSDTFDYIVCNQVLYHLVSENKIKHVLDEFKRVLKPDGKIIVSMLGEKSLFKVKGKQIYPFVYEYSYSENKMNEYLDKHSEPRRFFIPQNEDHLRKMFSMFRIDEIGFWHEVYLGNINHHYVVLARK